MRWQPTCHPYHYRLRSSLWSGAQCPSGLGTLTQADHTLRWLKYVNHKTNLLILLTLNKKSARYSSNRKRENYNPAHAALPSPLQVHSPEKKKLWHRREEMVRTAVKARVLPTGLCNWPGMRAPLADLPGFSLGWGCNIFNLQVNI